MALAPHFAAALAAYTLLLSSEAINAAGDFYRKTEI
jgi:hypothetical protein